MRHDDEAVRPSRRGFLGTSATAAAATALPLFSDAAQAMADDRPASIKTSLVPMTLNVNGQRHDLALDPRTTLLDALREHIGLTGSKKGCDHGQCGACTVHIDGLSVNACLTLALVAQGHKILTIEGLTREGGELHPLQQAFIDHDAFQCGYCTSGQIMSGVACIANGRAGSDAEIREFMSGNLCRCAAYPNIVRAIAQAKRTMGA